VAAASARWRKPKRQGSASVRTVAGMKIRDKKKGAYCARGKKGKGLGRRHVQPERAVMGGAGGQGDEEKSRERERAAERKEGKQGRAEGRQNRSEKRKTSRREDRGRAQVSEGGKRKEADPSKPS